MILMFKIAVSDAKSWRTLMAAISALVEEATFDIGPQGLSLRAMDPSHVAMVDFTYPKDSFQTYECDAATKLCVDLADTLKLMRRAESGETLEITSDPEAGHLVMKLTGRYLRRFSVPLLQPATAEVPTPKLSFDARVKMEADSLNDAMTDIAAAGEQVRFEANEEKLVMKGISETGNVLIEFEKDNQSILEFQVKGEVKSLYGVNFLLDMIKAGTATSKVASLEFSTDKPIKLDFELPVGGKLTYFLAPRLE